MFSGKELTKYKELQLLDPTRETRNALKEDKRPLHCGKRLEFRQTIRGDTF